MTFFMGKSAKLIAALFLAAVMTGCASSGGIDFDNDPDLFTSSEDIPNRPGILETLGEKELGVEL